MCACVSVLVCVFGEWWGDQKEDWLVWIIVDVWKDHASCIKSNGDIWAKCVLLSFKQEHLHFYSSKGVNRCWGVWLHTVCRWKIISSLLKRWLYWDVAFVLHLQKQTTPSTSHNAADNAGYKLHTFKFSKPELRCPSLPPFFTPSAWPLKTTYSC